MVLLVDGVFKFQTLVDYFGSYAVVEVALLLLLILPTLAVYRFTKNNDSRLHCYRLREGQSAAVERLLHWSSHGS